MPVFSDQHILLEQLKKHLSEFLLLLSEKERYVIERRYNLDGQSRATLESIGQHYNVTRERIRQIEKNALQKLRRNIENNPLHSINDRIYQLLTEHGGMLREDLLLSQILSEGTGYTASGIILIASLDKRLERLPNTIHYHPHVRLKEIHKESIEAISSHSLAALRKEKNTLEVTILLNELKKHFDEAYLTPSFLISLYQVHKAFKVLENSRVGLLEWPHIHPKTLRSKIFFVLRTQQNPMHFSEIANAIIQQNFDQKRINLQAVHNELIRCPDFVLIGRGIYALKEWGYSHGTVAEVIEKILKEKKTPLHQEQIIDEVFKRRQVKPITILLNLKNNKRFVRVGRKQYALKA